MMDAAKQNPINNDFDVENGFYFGFVILRLFTFYKVLSCLVAFLFFN